MPTLALVHAETGKTISPREMILHTEDRTLWRFDGIVIPQEHSKHNGQHMLRMSAYVAHFGRITRIFHPHVFGCVVKEIVERVIILREFSWKMVREQLIIPFWAGLLAAVGGAMFDYFHWADLLFKVRK